MTDRTVLADALQGSTVEMLREWAGVATTQADDVARLWRLSSNDSPELQDRRAERVKAFRGMAALALAIVSLIERQEAECKSLGYVRTIRWVVASDGDVEWFSVNAHEVPQTLPAAFAATLRGAP